ncbi:MAG: hypothetical protein JRH08_00725 [Deltaproteobacteria bacterium]|nr:hypothetical protein [Deltaproteobacteria bacterium]MBW2124227.1 hypothetical protein [Deltaproteobacteria bacterium]
MRNINTDVLSALAAEELRPFLLLEMTIDGTTYRYTNCDVPINYNGNTYEPLGMRIGSIRYNSTGMVDGFDITLDNLNSVFTSIFVGGTPQGSPVILRQMLMDNDWHILGQPWGLVAAYDFDEGSGTTLHDRSGNGNDGTIYGGPDWVTGKSGYALDFDGTDDYVSVPTSILNQDAGTWSAFVYVDSTTNNVRIFCSEHSSAGNYEFRTYYYSSTNGLFWIVGNGDTTYSVMLTDELSLDEWIHFCCIWEYNSGSGETTIKAYHNGSHTGSQSFSGKIQIPDQDIRIARWGSQYFDGKVDELRIYNRKLSDAEISYLYNNPGQDMSAGAITLFNGQIDRWSLDEAQLVMTIADMNVQWARKPLSRHPASCRWRVFKGPECGYTGSETWCDRSYARCSALGNTANFGGFRWLPSIMDKEIWWGRQPKS